MRGAYIDVPDLLTRHHPVGTAADARAYVARLKQFPDAIDDETRRLMADAKSGIVPPDFILNDMISVVESLSDGDAESHALMTGLYDRLNGPQDLEEDERTALAAEGLSAMEAGVLPAYARLKDTLSELNTTAPAEPGVWQLPNGSVYYQAVLEAYTLPDIDREALHASGLADVAALSAELSTALSAVGLEDGSVGERLMLLAQEDGQIYADDETGRAAFMAKLDAHMAAAQAAATDAITALPRTPVGVQEVPSFLEASAASALYTPAPANGSAPGLFRINLADMSAWPDFTLATLVFHETVPGHHIESAIAADLELSLWRGLGGVCRGPGR
jgi:uncharacterized protein (DUF885 family)